MFGERSGVGRMKGEGKGAVGKLQLEARLCWFSRPGSWLEYPDIGSSISQYISGWPLLIVGILCIREWQGYSTDMTGGLMLRLRSPRAAELSKRTGASTISRQPLFHLKDPHTPTRSV